MKFLIIIILSILYQQVKHFSYVHICMYFVLQIYHFQALTETCDCSSSPLNQYAEKYGNNTYVAKTVFGRTVPSLTASLTVGTKGPVLLQDTYLIESLQLFSRERIPQRVVHAKGTGNLNDLTFT